MKKRILIVEDHDDFRQMVRKYIDQHKPGLDIYEASSGEMGVTKASCVRPDIVLMDINLPHANGLETAKTIREDHPHCRIIFLTVFGVDAFKKIAAKIKASAFIEKSDIYEQLLPALSKCLDGKDKSIICPQIEADNSTKREGQNAR